MKPTSIGSGDYWYKVPGLVDSASAMKLRRHGRPDLLDGDDDSDAPRKTFRDLIHGQRQQQGAATGAAAPDADVTGDDDAVVADDDDDDVELTHPEDIREWEKMRQRRDFHGNLDALIDKVKKGLPPKGFFKRTPKAVYRNRDAANYMENQVAQYLALGPFANAFRFHSRFHAGQKCQFWLGPNSAKQHADYLIAPRPGVLHYANMHENMSHMARTPSGLLTMGHKPTCRRYTGKPLRFNADTEALDKFGRMYTEHMTRRMSDTPWPTVFKYSTYSECDFVHDSVLHTRDDFVLADRKLGKKTAAKVQAAKAVETCKKRLGIAPDDAAAYNEARRVKDLPSLRTYLRRFYSSSYVGRTEWLDNNEMVSEDDMVDHILNDPTCGGAVAIVGGVECLRNELSCYLQSYLCQKDTLSEDDLGGGGLLLIEQLVRRRLKRGATEEEVRAEIKREVAKRLENEYTLCRKHYSKPVCISVPYFR